MRIKGQVGQVICTCGRVGELRTRGNGKFLPFLMCKHCGMQQGKEALRDEWVTNEKPNHSLGVYGQFPDSSSEQSDSLKLISNKTSENVMPEQVITSNEVQVEHLKDWRPDEDNSPEHIKEELTENPSGAGTSLNVTSNTAPKSGLSLGAKFGIGFITLIAAVVGISNLNLSK